MILGIVIGLAVGLVILYEYHKYVTVQATFAAIERGVAADVSNLFTHVNDSVAALETKLTKKA